MPIYDQTFRRYSGPRHLRALWWPVAWFTLRPILKRKLIWFLLVGLLMFIGYISLSFFIVAKMQEFVPERESREVARTVRHQGIKLFGPDVPLGTMIYNIMQPLKGLMWLLVLAAGSGAISSDRRHNALPLYFSRPLKPWHYTFGKILGIGLMPLAALLFTQWICSIQYIAWYFPFSQFFKEIPTLIAAGFYALLLCGFVSVAMASISSMAKSSRVAGVGFLVFFVLTGRLIPLLAKNAGDDNVLALSPMHLLDRLGAVLLQPDLSAIQSTVETGNLSAAASLVTGVAYMALFLFLLRRNLRVVEIVK